MKIITLLFFFIAVNSYAANTCTPAMVALQSNEHGYVTLRTSNDHFGWTENEKQMIYKTVTLQEYNREFNVDESLEIFGDFYGCEQGENAGEIVYFKVGKKIIAKVHYWPGDNEYGSYVEMVGSKIHVLAEIHDGDVSCL